MLYLECKWMVILLQWHPESRTAQRRCERSEAYVSRAATVFNELKKPYVHRLSTGEEEGYY